MAAIEQARAVSRRSGAAQEAAGREEQGRGEGVEMVGAATPVVENQEDRQREEARLLHELERTSLLEREEDALDFFQQSAGGGVFCG